MRGLVDGDILVYELAELKNEVGEIIPLNWSMNALHSRLEWIKERSGSDVTQLYLTGKDNFRKDVATIVPYKGTRKTEKPKWYKEIRWEMENNLGAIVVDGMEADDAMSIEQYNYMSLDGEQRDGQHETVICSRDKDLNMVPGWHYGWEAGLAKETPLWNQDEVGGHRLFFKQLLTGDSVDNILGLFGVGKKSALLTPLDDMDDVYDMLLHVHKHYVNRFGSYAEQFMSENGKLLWMLQTEDDSWLEAEDLRQIKQDSLDLQADSK